MSFLFKIQIQKIQKPPVWRRVIVPEQFTFQQFHMVIQYVFDWEDWHLYSFSPDGYGSRPVISTSAPDDDWEKPDLDAMKTKLKDVFKQEKQTYTYIYDFGDDWIHKITLEEILSTKSIKASCIGGKGTPPPEDCGGVSGFERLKEIMADPKHEEYDEMKEWLWLEKDEEFDANTFDINNINRILLNI